jgi:hypothetical protein
MPFLEGSDKDTKDAEESYNEAEQGARAERLAYEASSISLTSGREYGDSTTGGSSTAEEDSHRNQEATTNIKRRHRRSGVPSPGIPLKGVDQLVALRLSRATTSTDNLTSLALYDENDDENLETHGSTDSRGGTNDEA